MAGKGWYIWKLGGPRYLERTGFYEDTLKVGETIIAGGRLSMRSDTEFLLEQITFSRWGSPGCFERLIWRHVSKIHISTRQPRTRAYFRVWSIPPNNEREVHTSLNALGLVKAAEFDPEDQFFHSLRTGWHAQADVVSTPLRACRSGRFDSHGYRNIQPDALHSHESNGRS